MRYRDDEDLARIHDVHEAIRKARQNFCPDVEIDRWCDFRMVLDPPSRSPDFIEKSVTQARRFLVVIQNCFCELSIRRFVEA